MSTGPTWVVLNQSQSPAFQHMLTDLARDLGPCELITGMSHPQRDGDLRIVPAPPYDRASISRRAASWMRFLGVAGLHLTRVRNRPFVWAVTNPPMLVHLAGTLARARGMRYGLLIWDLYPDHLVRMGWLSETHPATRAWAALNRRAFLGAEIVITIGDRMASAIRRQLGDASGRCRLEVVPNWADTTELRPLAKATNPFACEHGQAGKLTVMYSGNIGATHGLGGMTGAARRLSDRSDVHFLIIGDGLGVEEIRGATEGLKNVTLLPPQPWERLRESLATADVAVVAQAPGTEDLSVPSKTYAALATGSAILGLTSDDSDLAQLVREQRVGAVFGRDDVAGITATIEAWADRPELLQPMRERARAVAESRYSHEAVREQLRGLLAPCVKRARSG